MPVNRCPGGYDDRANEKNDKSKSSFPTIFMFEGTHACLKAHIQNISDEAQWSYGMTLTLVDYSVSANNNNNESQSQSHALHIHIITERDGRNNNSTAACSECMNSNRSISFDRL